MERRKLNPKVPMQALGEINNTGVSALLRYTATDAEDPTESLKRAVPSSKLNCQARACS